MKKMKKYKNILIGVIFFIVGFIVALALGYSATILFDSKDVKYDNTTGLSSTNVQDALDELYVKGNSCKYIPKECSTPPFNLGDYIEVIPDSSTYKIKKETTGYTSDQTITPNELDLWRVIKKNQCNVEVVSEYVSTARINFSGVTGYANYVGTLNEISRQYANKYVSDTRMMGYNGQTEYIEDTSAFDGSTSTAPQTTDTPVSTTGTGQEYNGGVLGDTLYLRDYQLVSNVYKTDTSTYGTNGLKAYDKAGAVTDYWIASRYYYYIYTTQFKFCGRSVSKYDYIYNYSAIRFRDYSWYNNNTIYNYAVRPIITLKSGITISGGSGTKDDPYKI